VSDIGVLHLSPPDSAPLWNVHHRIGMFITRSITESSGVNAKMDKADSAFPRVNLALLFAMHITKFAEKFVVLIRF
jgi:hypothetical protein